MLIVLPPKMRTTTRLVDRRVSIANLAPTIYDMAGINWSALPARFPDYPRSLVPLFTSVTPQYAATINLPKAEKQDHTEAAREREKALRALGYVH
jgi:hypothetical protein